MPKIRVMPAELRRFALYVDQWKDSLEAEEKRATIEFEHLETEWRDSQILRFQQKSQEMTAHLQVLKKTADRYREYLLRKAHAGDTYLGR